MPTVILEGPTYEQSEDPDPDFLRRIVVELPDDYWGRGYGGAILTFTGKVAENQMIVQPNEEFGIYLKVFGEGFDWLSLADRSRLGEITTCCHDWEASVGLFLPPEAAWTAIEAFCRTGERSPAVEWVKSTDMPAESNW